jgi:hypothetical protein
MTFRARRSAFSSEISKLQTTARALPLHFPGAHQWAHMPSLTETSKLHAIDPQATSRAVSKAE